MTELGEQILTWAMSAKRLKGGEVQIHLVPSQLSNLMLQRTFLKNAVWDLCKNCCISSLGEMGHAGGIAPGTWRSPPFVNGCRDHHFQQKLWTSPFPPSLGAFPPAFISTAYTHAMTWLAAPPCRVTCPWGWDLLLNKELVPGRLGLILRVPSQMTWVMLLALTGTDSHSA